MSSYNHLLKVFRESILEEAGLQEDVVNGEYAFKNWLFTNKEDATYEDGELKSRAEISLKNIDVDFFPKDLQSITTNELTLKNCNLKELPKSLCVNVLIIENCNDLTKIDSNITPYNKHNKYVSITNCNNLRSFNNQSNDYRIEDYSFYNCTNLTDISNINCFGLNLVNTKVTDLSHNIKCDKLGVDKGKTINIPFKCKVIEFPNKDYEMPIFLSHFGKLDRFVRDYTPSKENPSREELLQGINDYAAKANGVYTGNLEIIKDNISEFPKEVKEVKGKLTIKNCSFSSLPDNLIITKNPTEAYSYMDNTDLGFDLYNCPNLKQLPNKLQSSTYIRLYDLPIESIPTSLKCNTLEINNCNELKQLPDNFKINRLKLTNCSLTSLPNNLTCEQLIIVNCPITELPNNLVCENLDITNCPITEIPFIKNLNSLNLKDIKLNKLFNGNYKVKGLEAKYLTELPDKISLEGVGKGIDLSNSQLKQIDCTINGNFDLSNSKVETFPKNIYNSEIINISNTKIKELPKDLERLINLNISNTSITNLPDYLRCNVLNISNTQITNLPDNVLTDYAGGYYYQVPTLIATNSKLKNITKVSHYEFTGQTGTTTLGFKYPISKNFLDYSYTNLILSNTPFKELPSELNIENELDISNTEISVLPKSLKCKILNISNTLISVLPDNLKCKKLNISNTPITNLSDTLTVEDELNLTGTKVIELPQSLKTCKCIKGFIGNKLKYPDFHFEDNNSFDEDDI